MPDARARLAADARRHAALRLAPVALAAMLASAPSHADWRVSPRIELRETYSDNLGLQSDDLARGGFVTEASPSVSVRSNGPRLTLTADAGLRKYAYSNTDQPNLQNSERHYTASAAAKVIEDLFYVDAAASGSRQAISAFGPLSSNTYSSANTTDINTWRISPTLRRRFGSTADVVLRYTRDSVDGGIGTFSSLSSSRSADINSGSAFTTLGWNLSYYHQDLQDRIAGESSSENTTVGLRWRLVRTFSLTANAGYDSYEYGVIGGRTAGRSWSTGFVWTPSQRTSVQASFGRRYFGKTGSLASSYRTQRSIWNLDYSDAITTSRSQFLLPAAIDTASMLDSLFAASFPDPVQRQQAVQAYITANGLPASLANSINYLSNRYIRSRRLQGGVVLRGARSNLTMSVYSDKRTALSTQQSDSPLLGSQLASLNDDTAQTGATAGADYRLSSRSNAYASVNVARIRSLTTDVVNNTTEMRLGVNRRFTAKSQASLEFRRSRGRQDAFASGAFHENALAATFSVQY
jgi:uncharacterized protein (PEP-CTERM system associated)